VKGIDPCTVLEGIFSPILRQKSLQCGSIPSLFFLVLAKNCSFKTAKHRKGRSFVAAKCFFSEGILNVWQRKKRFDVTEIRPLRRTGVDSLHLTH